jgi:hypothetical protein
MQWSTCLVSGVRGRQEAAALQIDWAAPENLPPVPKLLGTKVFKAVPISDVVPYIDWNPFFQVWQLRGRYPNRGYPKIFNDATVRCAIILLTDWLCHSASWLYRDATVRTHGGACDATQAACAMPGGHATCAMGAGTLTWLEGALLHSRWAIVLAARRA